MKRLRATDDDVARRLPLDDGAADALDLRTRRIVARHWEQRAQAELRVASIFSVIARELFETGADPVVLRIAARAVSDEVRHADICKLVAERYSGTALPWPAPSSVPMPGHGRAPVSLRPTLHVTAMCCINETIASAWLEASQRDATAKLPRAAIRELLADDVHHARLGWAHLASSHVTPAMRASIAGWLPRLLQAAALPWLRDSKNGADAGAPRHGYPSRETTREVVTSTVRDVVLVGFDQLGVETRPAREWFTRFFEGQQQRR